MSYLVTIIELIEEYAGEDEEVLELLQSIHKNKETCRQLEAENSGEYWLMI